MPRTPSSAPAPLPLSLRARRARRVVRRALLARRRLLAALLAGLAVLAVVRALSPPPSPTAAVLVAARDLAAGTTVSPADVEVRTVPAGLVPPGTGPPDPAAVLGRVVAGPVGAGEQVSGSRLVGAGLAAASPGRTTLPVRLGDAAAVKLLQVGDRVDLVAADLQGGSGAIASPVATAVDVLAVPGPSPGDAASSPLTGATPPGSLVVVAVDPAEVVSLAQASAAGFVTFTWTGP